MRISRPSKNLRAQLFQDMNVTKRLMHPHFVRLLSELKLSPTQSYILLTVSERQPISLKALAAHMLMTPGAITQLVSPLEQRGLLMRVQDEKDRRTAYLTVTEEGAAAIQTINEFRDKIMTHLLSALTNKEIRQLAAIQRKMAEHLKENVHKLTTKKEQ